MIEGDLESSMVKMGIANKFKMKSRKHTKVHAGLVLAGGGLMKREAANCKVHPYSHRYVRIPMEETNSSSTAEE